MNVKLSVYLGREVSIALKRARYILERMRHLQLVHPAVEAFLEALSSFKEVNDGILGMHLAENWQEILFNFKLKFVPVIEEYFNTGNLYCHLLLAHLPGICTKYGRGLSQLVSDQVVDITACSLNSTPIGY